MKRPMVIALLVLALLFVLVGIGAVLFFALRGADFAFFNVPLVPATAEESKTLKIDAEKPVILSVNDDAGDVSIVGGDVEAVEIQIVKTGYGINDTRAEEALKSIRYELKQNGNSITLNYELSGRQTREVNTVDVVITVPTDTEVEIDNGFGVIDVTDLNGDVHISGDFGDVTVKNIEGALFLDHASGEVEISNIDAGSQDVYVESDFGRVTLEQVNGKDITVDSNSGSLTFTNVRATDEIFASSDFGNLTFENGSAASVTVDTNSGKVTLTKVNIRGALVITCDFGDVDLVQTKAGSYDIDSNSGGITVDGAQGSLKIYADFGGITVENAEDATLDLDSNSGSINFSGSLGKGPHSVQSDFGSVTLALPADSALNVELKTDFGSISSDIPITVTLDGDTKKNHQLGIMNGGGEEIFIRTNNGPIEITTIK